MTRTSFLMLYGGSFSTLLLATALVWRRFQPAAVAPIDRSGLDAVELAALTGGPERAAIAAMAALRSSAVRAGPGGTMLAHDELDAHAGELERELFDAVRGSPGAPARSLVERAAHGPAASRIDDRLKAAGLVLDVRTTALMHVLWACAAVLLAIGALAVLGHLGHHRVVPTLLSPLGGVVAASAALLWWIHRHRSGASRAGRRLVDSIGDRGEGLLGRTGGALEVALFGAGVLWTQDSAFASALGLTAADEKQTSMAGHILDFLFDGGDGCGCGCA
jgi:uncharacterized protein (TIGR04222 family)